jgi:site-specific recombinase XerD
MRPTLSMPREETMLPGEEMLIHRWEDWMSARGLSDETIRQYKYAMYRLQGETRPAKALLDMVQEDIIVYLASLGRRSAAKATYFRAFRSFYGWAYAQGDIARDITAGFRPKAATEPPVDAFTQEEIAAILESARARSEKRYYAILLCYTLGLRRSELCGIRTEDIDWSTRRVYVKEAKGGRPRWVEANALAMTALAGLVALNGTYTLVSYAPDWFTMIVHQAASEAGLPRGRRNAHMLRASFASHLIQGGASVPVVSRLLGHANIATTHRYSMVWPGDRRQAVNLLKLA